MQFVDLHAQYAAYKKEIDNAIQEVLDSCKFIKGPQVQQLEEALAEYAGVKHAIGCASGTDALLIPMMAYNVQPGDEVIVPDFTFIATAEMVALWKAVPVFADISPDTYNIDPAAIESLVTEKTVGIIPVSLYGQCADLDEINAIAEKHGLWVIEDAAQSFGAKYKDRKSCSLTDVATTSFFPAKPLGCYGDGGAVFTNTDELAEKMRIILNHGQSQRYHHKYIGINGRLDTIQAAILLVKLKYFDEEIERRNEVADRYSKELSDYFKTPCIKEENTSTYAQYTIEVKDRDTVRERLKQAGIPTAVHYPMPLHKQEAFFMVKKSTDYPNTDFASDRVLSLPMHPFMSESDISHITDTLKRAVK